MIQLCSSRTLANLVLTCCIASVSALADAETDATSSASNVIQTMSGPISGALSEIDPSIHVFKGIPYAKPPVGALRWLPPEPSETWSGVKDTTSFGDRCTQPVFSEGFYASTNPVPVSEDCLYLNVWTKTTNPEANQAVMVWIHGGAFITGSGSDAFYNGTRLATHDVTVVTINYRLGLYGFFAHPSLTESSEHKASGNQGLHDQIAALQWVQDNIRAFGGNPDKVTIFGESAGSMSVCYLVASPLAKGLFHQAIGQSGGCSYLHPTLTEGGATTTDQEISLSGHETGLLVSNALGQTGATEQTIESMQAMSVAEIAEKLAETQTAVPWRSIYVDGWMFPDQMRTLMLDGRASAVSTIVGSTRDEGTTLWANIEELSIEDWQAGVRENMPKYASRLIEAYQGDAEDSTKRTQQMMLSDVIFTNEMRNWARLVTGQGKTAFLYVFNHAPPIPNLGRSMGAFHGGEIQYIFQAPTADDSEEGVPRLWDDSDKTTAQLAQNYWINFAKTGNPNGEGLPNWPIYERELDSGLGISSQTEAIENFRRAKLDIVEEQALASFQ